MHCLAKLSTSSVTSPDCIDEDLPNLCAGVVPVNCFIHVTRALLNSLSSGTGGDEARKGTTELDFNSSSAYSIEVVFRISSIELISCSAKLGTDASKGSSKGSHSKKAPFIREGDFLCYNKLPRTNSLFFK